MTFKRGEVLLQILKFKNNGIAVVKLGCIFNVSVESFVKEKREEHQDPQRNNKCDIQVWKSELHVLYFPKMGNFLPPAWF
jgi:hypothetical protein